MGGVAFRASSLARRALPATFAFVQLGGEQKRGEDGDHDTEAAPLRRVHRASLAAALAVGERRVACLSPSAVMGPS